MKQILEDLEQVKLYIGGMVAANYQGRLEIDNATTCINRAISLLQAPRWETPEQWEKRTGETWPDDWAVYALYETAAGEERFWAAEEHCYARDGVSKYIVCATEAGPPPDDWEPEDEN
jgi:hypothetical protein